MERTVIFGVYDYSPAILGYVGFYFKEDNAHSVAKGTVERIINDNISKYKFNINTQELVIDGSAYLIKNPNGTLEKVCAVHAIMVQ